MGSRIPFGQVPLNCSLLLCSSRSKNYCLIYFLWINNRLK